MELGADDYITKPFTRTELLGAITTRLKKQATVEERYNSELQEAKSQLDYLIHNDSLTKLPNRLSLQEQFTQIQRYYLNTQQLVTVLCVGLDRFNQVNDNLGHGVGDLLLQAVAERLSSCIGSQNTVARLNADQFVVILSTIQHRKEAANFAQEILNKLSEIFKLAEQELFITASLGIALYPRDGKELELLLNHAHTAMLKAKQQGGDQFEFYTAAYNIGSSDRLALQTSLRYALERNELEVYYQPQVNLQTGEIFGAEALVALASSR